MNSAMGTCIPPVLDRSGNHIAITDNTYTVRIYDNNFSLLGRLPDSYGAIAFKPDGTRLYAYASTGLLYTFDLTASTVNGVFQTIGSAVSPAGNPGAATQSGYLSPYAVAKLITSPDGGTLFLAGSNLVAI